MKYLILSLILMTTGAPDGAYAQGKLAPHKKFREMRRKAAAEAAVLSADEDKTHTNLAGADAAARSCETGECYKSSSSMILTDQVKNNEDLVYSVLNPDAGPKGQDKDDSSKKAQ